MGAAVTGAWVGRGVGCSVVGDKVGMSVTGDMLGLVVVGLGVGLALVGMAEGADVGYCVGLLVILTFALYSAVGVGVGRSVSGWNGMIEAAARKAPEGVELGSSL